MRYEREKEFNKKKYSIDQRFGLGVLTLGISELCFAISKS